jgi:subtilisin family serine protease
VLLLAAPLALAATRPNDPDFPKQWALENTGQTIENTTGTPGADIDAVKAWDITTGSTDVVVGVLDTGIAATYSDLAPNMWENPGDIGGCPAGTHGYDAADDDCYPNDSDGHGSDVAAVLGARGNNGNRGTGLAWTTQIMALRFVKEVAGIGAAGRVVEAIDWAIAARDAGVNVRVLNMSFGEGLVHSNTLKSAIRRAGEHGILFVTASGNDSRDIDAGNPFYPCSHDLPTLICVGGSDQRDGYVFNWGAESVDLAAPAVNVYGLGSSGTGTSLAAPLVSAAAALIWSEYPGLTPEQVKAKILHNVDVLPSHAGKTVTGGRLNVYRALTGPIPEDPSPPATTTTTAPGSPAPGSGGGGGTGGGHSGDPGDPGDPGVSGDRGDSGNADAGSSRSDGLGVPGLGIGGASGRVGGAAGVGPPGASVASGGSASGGSASGGSASSGSRGRAGSGAASDEGPDGDRSGGAERDGRPSGVAVARYDDSGGRARWSLLGVGGLGFAGSGSVAFLLRRRWLPVLGVR